MHVDRKEMFTHRKIDDEHCEYADRMMEKLEPCLVAEGDEIAQEVDLFLAQPKVGGAAAVAFVDLVHAQLLHLS